MKVIPIWNSPTSNEERHRSVRYRAEHLLKKKYLFGVMASAKRPPKALSQIIDRVEEIREELLIIQRALERIEPAEDFAESDRRRNSKSKIR